jgi:hypothetical protein
VDLTDDSGPELRLAASLEVHPDVVHSQAACLDEREIFGRMVERPSALSRRASMQEQPLQRRAAFVLQERRADRERCLLALMVAQPRALSRREDAPLADARSQEQSAQQGVAERSSDVEQRAKRKLAPLPGAQPVERQGVL